MIKVEDFKGNVMVDAGAIESKSRNEVINIAKEELKMFCKLFIKELVEYWEKVHSQQRPS